MTPLHRAIAPDPRVNANKNHDEIAMLLLEQPDMDVNARNGAAFQEAIVSGQTGNRGHHAGTRR